MADVVIFGTGQISEVVQFYLERDTSHKIVAFTTDEAYITGSVHNGRPVLPFETLEEEAPISQVSLLIPISYRAVNRTRMDRYRDAKLRGYSFISYISPKATYYDTPVGENTLILEDNTLQPFTSVGNNVILWSGCNISHHSQIGDHCFLSSHVVLSGAVTVGEQCFFGANAIVHDNVTLGRECVIGAGSIISKSLPDHAVSRPARSHMADIKSYDLKGF